MNLTHLQSFMMVVKMQSFSAASEQLEASKGLVSRHVKALEDERFRCLANRSTFWKERLCRTCLKHADYYNVQ